MSKFNGQCEECGCITALNRSGICGNCYNDRDESWLEHLFPKDAKEFALENLTYYNDDNGYYLHIENGDEEDLGTLFSLLENEDEDLIYDAAEESKKHYNEFYGNLCFKNEKDFNIFFNILINKIKAK